MRILLILVFFCASCHATEHPGSEEFIQRAVSEHGLDESEVREFCKDRITYFKTPHYIRFVDSFPMTVTGKIQKFKMRETMIAELGL